MTNLLKQAIACDDGIREWKSRKRRRRYTYLKETADEAPDVTFSPASAIHRTLLMEGQVAAER